MRPGDRVEVLPVPANEGCLRGRGTLIAVQRQRSEVGYLVLIDGEPRSSYFGPSRVIPISEESQQHMTAGE